MKRVRKVISLLAVLCMVLTMNLTVFATSASNSTPDVAAARKGIIQVRLYYVDNNGEAYCLQTGSGFLIGTASGATNVITNYHVITLPDHTENPNDWDKESASEAFGVDFFNSNEVDLRIRVAVKRDLEIDASYFNGSEQTDFAILELAQPIYDRAPLQLANSDDLLETQPVYALGFPGVASRVEDDSVFTTEDVTITNGIVGKFQTINNIKFVLHNAQLSAGNSGGPLVDSTGAVVGVNTLFYGDDSGNYYSSIAINEVASTLDALGVEYTKAGETAEPSVDPEPEPVPEPVPEPEPAPEKTCIEGCILEAGHAGECQTEKEGPNMLLIGGGIAGVVLIAVIIIIIVMLNKNKKKAPQGQAGMSGRPVALIQPQGQAGMSSKSAAPVQPTPPSFAGGTMPVDTGAGETSVLGGGAGETSVLGGGTMQPTATLIRKKNGETATITKAVYMIGKERRKVDFCIPDNNSISRSHANIICKGGIYYIADQNSTNYTFVNGNKITPNQEVKLNNGDKIKLADEEFEFRF